MAAAEEATEAASKRKDHGGGEDEGVGVEAAATASPERQEDLLKLLDAVTHDSREARLRCVRATDENAALRAELGVARQRLGWPEVTDTEVRLVVDGKATDSLLCEKLLRTRLEDPSALASLLRKDD